MTIADYYGIWMKEKVQKIDDTVTSYLLPSFSFWNIHLPRLASAARSTLTIIRHYYTIRLPVNMRNLVVIVYGNMVV